MVPDAFSVEGYFEVYVNYLKDRRQARAKDQDPGLVEFHLPAAIERGLEDEETVPPDGEAPSPDPDSNGAGEPEESGRDEDPDI